MLLTIKYQNLSTAITRAIATTDAHSAHPFTGCLKVEASEGTLRLSSTNLIASTITTCAATVSKAGIVVVNAARLAQIVSGFDAEDDISINTTAKMLIVTQRNRRYELKLHETEHFPSIAVVQQDTETIEISPTAFSQIFERVSRFIDPDRQQLAGIYFHASNGTLEGCGFSGHRHARATIAIPAEIPERWWFLPTSFYRAAQLLCKEAESVSIGASERYLSLATNGYETGTVLPHGVDPHLSGGLDYCRDILEGIQSPGKHLSDNGVIVHPTQLLECLTAISLGIGKSGFAEVTLDVQGGFLRVTGRDPEGDCGVAMDTVPMIGEEAPNPRLDIKLNSIYLTEVLKSIGPLMTKQVVLNYVQAEGITDPLLGVSIGAGADFGTASYIISPVGKQ